MIEMSAAPTSVLALPGAAIPAVAAAVNTDGAQIVDFSAVLAGATLAGDAPARLSDMLAQPEADEPPAPERLPDPATLPGKNGISGNPTGKNLPVGKLPAPRLAAFAEKASRKQLSEGAEFKDQIAEAAPEQDAVITAEPADVPRFDAVSGDAAWIETAPVPAAPVAPNTLVGAPAPQPGDDRIPEKPQATLTKLQSRQEAKLQRQTAAAKTASDAAAPAAAKLSGTPAAKVRGSKVDGQPTSHGDAARVSTPSSDHLAPVSAPVSVPPAAGVDRAAPAVDSAAESSVARSPIQTAPISAAPITLAATDATTIAPANVAPAVIARATIAAATVTPATVPSAATALPTITLAATAPTTVAPVSIAPAVTAPDAIASQISIPAIIDLAVPSSTPLAAPVVGARAATEIQNAPEPVRASLVTMLAQVAPAAAVPTMAPADAAALPIEPVADQAGTGPRKAAILAATLPTAAMPVGKAPAAPSQAEPAPVTLANVAPATVSEAAARQAPDAPTIAASAQPAQLVQAPAPSTAAVPTAPTIALAPNLQTIAREAPAPQDRRAAVGVALRPGRGEAAGMPAVLLAAEKDQTAVNVAIAPVTGVEAPAPFARTEMDASRLAAEFRSAPMTSAAPTSSASPAPANPTQDIAALVDRITEARAAAAPHTVRASLMHEDFGAVTVNLRTEASHIHVTLGNADPGFAPAVQAAAAASLAGNTSDDSARRDAPTPQPFTPAQDSSARADTSSQQQAPRDRAPAPERAAPREAPARPLQGSAEREPSSAASRRRGGLYA